MSSDGEVVRWTVPCNAGARRGTMQTRIMRCSVFLLALSVLFPGCYLRHGFEDAPMATPSTPGSTVDGGSPGMDASGFDAGPLGTSATDSGLVDPTLLDGAMSGGDAEVVDVPFECEALCAAWDANGCGAPDCMRSCVGRAGQAERIGCLSEWKLITRCLRSDPCRVEGCPEMSGWPECVRRGGG